MQSFCFSHIEDELHHNFSISRSDGESSVYVEDGVSKLHLHINAYCDGSTKKSFTLPLVVLGAAGVGKSAILANWSRQRKANAVLPRGLGYQEFVFYHFIGCSRLSTGVLPLLRRLITSLINHFELRDAFNLADEKLPWVLPRLLEQAAKKGKVIIVIDGLHHICSQDSTYGMKWLPLRFHQNVKIVISVTKPTEHTLPLSDYAIKREHKILQVWEEIKRRGCPMINMTEFDQDQVVAIAEKYLSLTSSRSPMSTEILINQILSHECSKNALFLTTLLRGLRHITDNFDYKTQEVARVWTSSTIKNTHDLVDSMLTVFESGLLSNAETTSPPRHTMDTINASKLGTLLRHSLSLLFVSRHGLLEDELLDLVACVREDVRWSNDTRNTVVPIKIKIIKSIVQKKERLLTLFRSFDTNGNGTLDRQEFCNGMNRLNLGLTEDEVTLLMDEVDNNGDGEIDYIEILDHFEDISRKYMHGGRRRSVFCDEGTAAVIAKDKESFTDDYKRKLIATLQCVGVLCMNGGHNDDRILSIPFENVALRDIVWKRYLKSTKGEAESRNFLTGFFNKKGPSHRICEELPWHLKKSNELALLKKLMTDLRVIDLMYTTELKQELFTYLFRLSRSNKFDIVIEYNRAVEKWQKMTNPTASQLCSMVSFLGEVLSWYSRKVSSLQKAPPPFMRPKLSFNLLEKLELKQYQTSKGAGRKPSIDPENDYYLMRWIWIQCPWLALSKTRQAMRQPRELSTTIPKEIINDDISSFKSSDSSRSQARTNTSKTPSRMRIINAADDISDLEIAYSRLNAVREQLDGIITETSEKSRQMQSLISLVVIRTRGDDKQQQRIAARESVVEQLQVRLDHIKEMADTAARIEIIHEEIIVTLQSCQPAFQNEHLELEQHITFSEQQMIDLRAQHDYVDGDIIDLRKTSEQLISDVRDVLAEKESMQPHMQLLRDRKQQQEYTLHEQAKRNPSFDPSVFSRRMKMEGIIAKRRQMKTFSQNKVKFASDAKTSAALHPLQKIAHAAGSFNPSQIAEKIKASESLWRDLSLRQDKCELVLKKRRGLLEELYRKIKDHQMFEYAENTSAVLEMDQGVDDIMMILDNRQRNLLKLNALVKNIKVAMNHIHDLAENIEQLNKENSLLPNFLRDKSKPSSGSDPNQIVFIIKRIRDLVLGGAKPSEQDENSATTKFEQNASMSHDFKHHPNTRVLSRGAQETDFDEVTV